MSIQYRNRSDGQVEEVHSEEEIANFIKVYIIYGVEGVLMTLTNSLIVCAILRFKSLREQKEFIIIGGLAFADGLNGFGYLTASIGRLILMMKGDGELRFFHSFLCAKRVLASLFVREHL